LRIENARLAKELEDAQLDLEDARRSRRDMQQQLSMAAQRVAQSDADCASMRVWITIYGGGLIYSQRGLLIIRADSKSLYSSFA
jgi:hypothetical protein